jgi:hypothetical protein
LTYKQVRSQRERSDTTGALSAARSGDADRSRQLLPVRTDPPARIASTADRGRGDPIGMVTKGDLVNPEPAHWIRGEVKVEDVMNRDVLGLCAGDPCVDSTDNGAGFDLPDFPGVFADRSVGRKVARSGDVQ